MFELLAFQILILQEFTAKYNLGPSIYIVLKHLIHNLLAIFGHG